MAFAAVHIGVSGGENNPVRANFFYEGVHLREFAQIGFRRAGGNQLVGLPFVDDIGAEHAAGTQNENAHRLFVLGFPVIVDVGIVVGDAQFVGRIVVAVCEVY